MARRLLFLLLLAVPAGVQEQPAAGPRLQIASVDRSDYPIIGLNLIATSPTSEPRAEFTGLRLWENGVPIVDFALEQTTVGLELFVLLDIAPDWTVGDDGLPPPLLAVQESLLRLAGRLLEAERDVVWLAAPGGRGARWLLQEATDPAQLAAAAAEIEAPAAASGDPADLLALALEHAVQRAEQSGRFAAVVLYSQGSGLSATRLQALSAEAQALQLPIFLLLTSPVLEESTLANLDWLSLPTRGAIAELADTRASDSLYALLAANATQTQVRYLSNADGGEVPVRVTLGNLEDSTLLDLALQPPTVEIGLAAETTIRRVGIAPESVLTELQPAVQTVPVSLSWPDSVPRRVQSATLLMDGAAQVAPVLGGADGLEFDWDISLLDEGAYVLTAEVTDSAGLTATSPPRIVSITVARPAPVPTEPPPTVPPPAAPATRPLSPELIGLGGGLFLLLGLFLLWRTRRQAAGPARQGMELPVGDAYIELETGQRWPLVGEVSIGRGNADISFPGEGVALLHARLMAASDGYWLYDEGSSTGTVVNGERLGLAGRRLDDGDQIRFGEVDARFLTER